MEAEKCCGLRARGQKRRKEEKHMEKIHTEKAPAAIGPYSQAMKQGWLVFTSGQIPLDPATGKLVEGDICAQAEQCCKNVVALLESQGLTTAHVVKTTVFIADMNDFPKVNEVYKKYFREPFPARSCVAIKSLPLGAQVEVEAIAAR